MQMGQLWGKGWNNIHLDHRNLGGNHSYEQTICCARWINAWAFCAFIIKINYYFIPFYSIAMSTQLYKFTVCASTCLYEMLCLCFL